MIIDKESPVYPYMQIAGHLRQRIADGEITRQLPSYTELMDEADASLGTVQRAIKVLIEEGLVFTVRGRGTYVRKDEA